jgi:hypothetical protein
VKGGGQRAEKRGEIRGEQRREQRCEHGKLLNKEERGEHGKFRGEQMVNQRVVEKRAANGSECQRIAERMSTKFTERREG